MFFFSSYLSNTAPSILQYFTARNKKLFFRKNAADAQLFRGTSLYLHRKTIWNLHVFLTVYTATSSLSNHGKNAPKVQQFISQIQEESFHSYISSYSMLFKFTVTICFSNIFPILRMRTIWHREPCSFGMLCVCILWDSNPRSDPQSQQILMYCMNSRRRQCKDF